MEFVFLYWQAGFVQKKGFKFDLAEAKFVYIQTKMGLYF